MCLLNFTDTFADFSYFFLSQKSKLSVQLIISEQISYLHLQKEDCLDKKEKLSFNFLNVFDFLSLSWSKGLKRYNYPNGL